MNKITLTGYLINICIFYRFCLNQICSCKGLSNMKSSKILYPRLSYVRYQLSIVMLITKVTAASVPEIFGWCLSLYSTRIDTCSLNLLCWGFFFVKEIGRLNELSALSTLRCAHTSYPTHALYSLSGRTSYRKTPWSLEDARFEFRLFQSLWNLTGTSATALSRCLPNRRTI